jgi:hypothetical protein
LALKVTSIRYVPAGIILLEQGEFRTFFMFLFRKDRPISVLCFAFLCLDMELEIKAAIASSCTPDAKPVSFKTYSSNKVCFKESKRGE